MTEDKTLHAYRMVGEVLYVMSTTCPEGQSEGNLEEDRNSILMSYS